MPPGVPRSSGSGSHSAAVTANSLPRAKVLDAAGKAHRLRFLQHPARIAGADGVIELTDGLEGGRLLVFAPVDSGPFVPCTGRMVVEQASAALFGKQLRHQVMGDGALGDRLDGRCEVTEREFVERREMFDMDAPLPLPLLMTLSA